MLGTLMVGSPQSSFALDPLPRSPRVGSLRIPLLSYNRVPISALLSDSASYHLREIRIAGIVRTVETQLMTRGCGKPYELTMLSLEDESGMVDVIDQGACGKKPASCERQRSPPATASSCWSMLSEKPPDQEVRLKSSRSG